MNINFISIVISSLVAVSIAAASSDLNQGDPAPNIVLKAVDGTKVDTSKLKGNTLLVLFGDTAQAQTERAYQLINKSLESSLLHDEKISWLLILSKNSAPNKISFDWSNSKHKPLILHDTQRQAFGAYRTVVTPSAVIIDKQGKIVHRITGFTPFFGDTVLDALLVSVGIMSPELFNKNLKGGAEEVKDEKNLRAERFAHFAQRLSKRSMTSLAESNYRQALELVPDLKIARLGLADLLLVQSKIGEAKALFQSVIDDNPDSEVALLGLASIFLKQVPPDISPAQLLVERVIKQNQSSALGFYMLGTIYEMQGDFVHAAANYKKSTELLLK